MPDKLKDEIRRLLKSILASPPFQIRSGDRPSHFLRYVVEENLKGNSTKQGDIANSALGIADLQPDNAIVRVTAHTLRLKLLEYYRFHGPSDPIRIEIPKGRYVPVFTRLGSNEPISISHEDSVQSRASPPLTGSKLEPVRRERNPAHTARYMEVMRSLTPISAHIKSFCAQHDVTPIDQFIPLRASPGLVGWPEDKVSKFPIVDPHAPLPELQTLMERFPPDGAINQLYSLQSWECDTSIGDEKKYRDEIPHLRLSATGGNWRQIFALQQAWLKVSPKQQNVAPDAEYLAIHQRFEAELASLIHQKQSRLYCNLNTEALLVTSDNQILLARRSGAKKTGKGGTAFSHDLWSASFEEQVMRRKEEDDTSDLGDVFACAERGAWEEFGATIAESKLMSFGIEWGNFTLALLFLLRCNETYAEIRDHTWENVASDPDEAVAIDCINAEDPDELTAFCKLDTWTPSRRAKKSLRLEVDAPSPLVTSKWHPVARARLLMWFRHRFG